MEVLNLGIKRPDQDYAYRESCYGIVQKDDQILVVFSEKDGDYSLPGGGMEPNETMQEALQREFLEEAGRRITESEHLIDARYFGKSNRGVYLERFAHIFVAKVDENEVIVPLEPWHKPMFVDKMKAIDMVGMVLQKEVLKRYL